LTRAIVGAAFEVSNRLGCGFGEKVYENALLIELRLAGHQVEQQRPIEVRYRQEIVGLYQPDLVVDDAVVVELKALPSLQRAHRVQCLNYLRAMDRSVGLVINFGVPRMEFQKVVRKRGEMADGKQQGRTWGRETFRGE